ncbi:MAG: c-type cytochrome [Burkholderiaceae bacterium]|nr:c-type cytochrome [Burkholderiaceae bacterium]
MAALACVALVCAAHAQTASKKPKAGAQSARASAASAAAAERAAGYAQRFAAVCVNCHGPGGRSEQPGVPVLAGQHSFYAITQLFLFREGRRDNAAMSDVAKTMTDNDLRGFADHIGTLPPASAAPQPPAPDAARMKQGAELARQHKCVFCHGSDFAGGQQVPRIAGQREEYLRDTLHGFRTGKRPGYTQAMIGALATVPAEDLDTLAYYAAHFPAAAASAPAGR